MNRSTWRANPPTIEELNGEADQYFWVRGGNFNRPLMARVNAGVNSDVTGGARKYWADVNFTFFAENYPPHIWRSDLGKWPGLANLEWAGPVCHPVPLSGAFDDFRR